jgi:hypothetical protein
MDWDNVDFNSSYERDQDFLDGYDFNTLILELVCNYPKETVNAALIRKHVSDTIRQRVNDAVDIIDKNAEAIAKEVINYHKID